MKPLGDKPTLTILSFACCFLGQAGIAWALAGDSRADVKPSVLQLAMVYLGIALGGLAIATLVGTVNNWILQPNVPSTDINAIDRGITITTLGGMCICVVCGSISGYAHAGFGGALLVGLVGSWLCFLPCAALPFLVVERTFWKDMLRAAGSVGRWLVTLGVLVLIGWLVIRYWNVR